MHCGTVWMITSSRRHLPTWTTSWIPVPDGAFWRMNKPSGCDVVRAIGWPDAHAGELTPARTGASVVRGADFDRPVRYSTAPVASPAPPTMTSAVEMLPRERDCERSALALAASASLAHTWFGQIAFAACSLLRASWPTTSPPITSPPPAATVLIT